MINWDLDKIKKACETIYYVNSQGIKQLKAPSKIVFECGITFEDYKIHKWLKQKGQLENKVQEEAITLIENAIQKVLSEFEQMTLEVSPVTKQPIVQPNAYNKIWERWVEFDVKEMEMLVSKLSKEKILQKQKENLKKVKSPIVDPSEE